MLNLLDQRPQPDPAMLGRLGGYEISGVIGCGGMGVVLKGFDRPLNRVVAIKVMVPHLASSGAARRRFSREAQAAAAITHDNVIDIYGVAEADGLPYLVMPYARGPSLQNRIDQSGPLPLAEVLRIGVQVAAGLAAAHGQGLVHRDIKPANILLSDGIERLVITDFGLARTVDDASVTKTGIIAGTPQYMSPEQARGERVDHRSDLFSLGSVLYTACTGHAPFRADTAFGVLRRVTDEEPRSIRETNPDIPDWLCEVIRRLHAKAPSQRPASAADVAAMFKQCLAHVHEPLSNPLPSLLPEQPDGKARKRLVPALTAAGLSVAVIAAITFAARSHLPSRDPTAPRQAVQQTRTPRTEELRYIFPTDRTVTYLLTMFVDLPEADVQLDGLVVVESQRVSETEYRLWISPDLQISETLRGQRHGNRGITYTGTGTRSSRWKSSRYESATINDRGEILSDGQLTELPYHVGALAGLLFQPLPGDANSPDIVRCDTRITYTALSGNRESRRSDSTDHDIDYCESVFSIGSGIPNTVRAARTVAMIVDGAEQQAPMQLEFLRLTDDDRDAWLAARSDAAGSPGNRRRAGLSPDEEQQLRSDLTQDRRVLYWLHRVRTLSISELSPNVIDALANLVDHPNPTSETLVRRILNEIPDEKLNPFRITQ